MKKYDLTATDLLSPNGKPLYPCPTRTILDGSQP